MVLRPNGTVVAVGGDGQLAIYDSSANTWSAGPVVGGGLGSQDGPAVLLPNGNVFFQVSSFDNGCKNNGSSFFEYGDGGLGTDPPAPNAGSDPSFAGEMLLLPTGQVLFSDLTENLSIYTPGGTYQSAWQPTISSVGTTLVAGAIGNLLSGTQLNGLSQGSMYGDDVQMATNFPLVRITNNATGHVFYCRTHNFSTMAVATGSTPVSTEFDVPAGIEVGPSTLVVVTNGIPSNPVSIDVNASTGVQNVTVSPTSLGFHSSGGSQVTETASITNNGPGTLTIYRVSANGDYFSLHSTTCGSELGQSQTCTASVTFSPGPYCLSGTAYGTLYFSDSGQGGQQTVSLSGTTSRCQQIPSGGPKSGLAPSPHVSRPGSGLGGVR